jgi:Tol biopolymer transport system component
MTLGQPVPSKDGKRIFAIGGLARGHLARYEAKSRQFVPFLSGISATDLDFSRDGNWAAYVALPEGTLWRCKMDGSERLQLTYSPMQVQLPRWSPDGKQIAFSAQVPGRPWKINSVSTEGGICEQMIQGEKNEYDSDWSVDGNLLYFGTNASSETSTAALAILVLNLRTHQITTLPGSEGHYAPRLSPNGRYLAAQKPGTENLWLFDFEKQEWEELTKESAGYFRWSRDGNYVYFDNIRFQREPGFFRVRISDHKLDQVASLKDLQPYGILGVWSGLAPDDSPLLLRNVGSQKIYALDWEAP